MLVKLGVSIDKLERPIRRALTLVDGVFKSEFGIEAVITSTYEGDHQPGSLHYANLAVDFRIRNLTMAQRDDMKLAVKKALRERYGDRQYDVLFSANDTCLHIEYEGRKEPNE